MIKLKSLARTCYMCPSQWEGITDDNRTLYGRYRHGHFTLELGQPNVSIDDDTYWEGTELILDLDTEDHGDGNGYMTNEEFMDLTRTQIDFSEVTEIPEKFSVYLMDFKTGTKTKIDTVEDLEKTLNELEKEDA